MRFLVAFLLLFCFHLSIANALEDDIAVVVKKSNPVLDKANVLSKKNKQILDTDHASKHLNRIYQGKNQRVHNTLNFMASFNHFITLPKLPIQKFAGKVDYSYLFIFNCLFPKHTFW